MRPSIFFVKCNKIFRLNYLSSYKAFINSSLTVVCVKKVPLQGAIFLTDYASKLAKQLKSIHVFRCEGHWRSYYGVRSSGSAARDWLRWSQQLHEHLRCDDHWEQRWIHSLRRSTDIFECEPLYFEELHIFVFRVRIQASQLFPDRVQSHNIRLQLNWTQTRFHTISVEIWTRSMDATHSSSIP